MSVQILPPTTAGTRPDYFSREFFLNRKLWIIVLSFFLLAGFGLRVWNLGSESLSEDELNKLETVAEYRTKGLTGRNGEHPFLMKGFQTLSLTAADELNKFAFSSNPNAKISDESALRFPTAIFGTLTILLIFLVTNELFGSSIGLIAAALWAVDPNAVGFDRIAKEDSFLLFFFLLANFFWLRGQTKAENKENNWTKCVWLTAISFGAMFASKYLFHLIFITIGYFTVIRAVPTTNWRIGKNRWLIFYALIGVSFLIFNPTVLLPDTWRQMLSFSREQKIVHDSYEFAGNLYQNKLTLWLSGVPWTFFYVYILVKTPILTLIFFLVGLPILLRRKLGDGRFFILLWLFLWFLPFTFLGGKFTRYFTTAEPLILILAAIGSFITAKWLGNKFFSKKLTLRYIFIWTLPAVMIAASFFSSFSFAPNYRLYTNKIGGGKAFAGFYFPHDEFYDTSVREVVSTVASQAGSGSKIANETPGLFEYYFKKNGRNDLISISLSDKTKIANLTAGDFIVDARGRRYFSNKNYLDYLENTIKPFAEINISGINSVKIYQLDETSAEQIRNLAR